MARFTACKGTQYTLNNRDYELKRMVKSGWQVENSLTGILEVITLDEFYDKYKSGALIIKQQVGELAMAKGAFGLASIDLESLSPDVKATIQNKRMVVLNFLRVCGSKLSKTNAAKFLKNEANWPVQLGKVIYPDTLLKWTSRFLKCDKNPLCFLKLDHKKGNREVRVDQAVEELAIRAINEVYMSSKKHTLTETLARTKELIDLENALRPIEYKLIYPSINFIRRLIRDIPQVDKDVARLGKELASHIHRESIGTIETKRPLYRAEVDHTKLDVIVVDDETGLPIGRPWLTLIVDADSRCVLGFHITIDPPSHATVAKALRHAIMPKTDAELRERCPDIKGTYPMYGVMQFLVTDNGLEFHSLALEKACYELAIILCFTPRKRPWWKGTIERLLGTLNRQVTGPLDGKTFASITERKDYKSSDKAIYTLRELDALIMRWVVDVYHQTKHRSLGMTPARYWDLHANKEALELPLAPTMLDSILGQITKAKPVHHYGIELNSIVYNNHDLMELRQVHGAKLKLDVRWNSDEMGEVFVYVPGGGVLRVEANKAFIDYATGITLYQHNIYRSYCERMNKEPDLRYSEALIVAKEDVQKIAKTKFQKGNNKTRVAIKRLLNGQTNANKPAEVVKVPEIVTQEIVAAAPVSNRPRPQYTAIHTPHFGK